MAVETTKGLTSLLKGINLNKVLTNTNKTLNFVKQGIPVYNQIKPMFGNVKTFLNMYGAVKEESDLTPNKSPMQVNKVVKEKEQQRNDLNDTLKFFQ